ncbi:hypothetical protein O3P69_002176 [Scylla paramamosain]|uniref:Glutaredoxin domain-containing protein n=1 Tax=Scylla paramamosain TaxID=85552 RepID=A0AAW0V604_SCYPA
MAKKAFKDLGVPYDVYELDKQGDGLKVQDVLDSMTGCRTVPRVFVGGKCIGGGSETRQLYNEERRIPAAQFILGHNPTTRAVNSMYTGWVSASTQLAQVNRHLHQA